MNWRHFFLMSSICSYAFFSTNAQDLKKTLNEWEIKNPVEKIYIHTDRKMYFAGQTIWLKSYFLSKYKPSQDNSTLFVELLNRESAVILKKVLPVFNAITYGQLELPDSLSTGTYWLRAYSPLMLNHAGDYLYSAPVKVFGKTSKKKIENLPKKNTPVVTFFSEGGNLIENVPNNVAFKATDGNGYPHSVSGMIKSSAGDTVITFRSTHNGMGSFSLKPESDQSYTAIIDSAPPVQLPKAEQSGIAVQVKQLPDNQIQYDIIQGGNDERFKPAYYIAQMQNKALLQNSIDNNNGNHFSGSFTTSNFKSGILQLTFFNKDKAPLAERLVFINHKEYELAATLESQKMDAGKRKPNHFSIQFPDSIDGNFSIAITDADYDEPGQRKENIISSFLLTGDLPGYIHDPAWYFTGEEKAAEALDLLMLTHGWRRFKWSDVAGNTLPAPVHKDPGYISLSGKVNIRNSKKDFADRDLLIWMSTPNAGRNLQMVTTDAQGKFQMDSVVFFDKAKILFSDIMGKKSDFITVKLNTDSLYKTFKLPGPTSLKELHHSLVNSLTTRMQTAFFDYSRGEGLLLDNVEIEGRKLTNMQLEEKYMSGLFKGDMNARTINLTGQFVPQWNLFEWLMGRFPNLIINRVGNFEDHYRLFFRQRPVQLFLDEMPLTDATLISAIPANQIAFVKLYPQFLGARGNNAALAVYTKRGEDITDEIEATGDIIDYEGYSIIKEYYSPDYSTNPEINYKDYRLTLDWQPEIQSTATKSISVQFYNNDRTKRFKIVAEGMTKDGKMLMLEKVIEPADP